MVDMPIEGEYEPSALDWVRDQVAEYEASGGTRANTLRDTGIPVVIVTMRGARSGKVRKIALMRVEHEGSYALVASYAGRPSHPAWYANLVADPHVMIQDGPAPRDFVVREVTGDERAAWWERAVAVFPTYADYAVSADEHGRTIPVLVAEPAS
jgi:deazaflavin-dependent oxidoreductase (nitroreductase family)